MLLPVRPFTIAYTSLRMETAGIMTMKSLSSGMPVIVLQVHQHQSVRLVTSLRITSLLIRL